MARQDFGHGLNTPRNYGKIAEPLASVWRKLTICLRWWSAGVWQIPSTGGFEDGFKLTDHFLRHGSDFGCRSSAHYEAMADRFLGGPKGLIVKECRRRSGDLLRFNALTEAYGVLAPNGIVRSHYIPTPCASLPPGVPRRGCHGCRDNFEYFKQECARIW